MKIKSYKDLDAYKKAYEVAKLVYNLTKSFPKEELYSLTAQLRRCAISVPSNIAEGYMRGSNCTLTLFCRLPSLNLEKMGKIGARVPVSSSDVVPRYVKKILDKKILM